MDFSIVIPAKNESKNIGNCIQSIKQNSHYSEDLYEIIVVDNGSSDNTVEISESLGARVFNKPDVTISFLRNYGASRASGAVLVFLDADCTVNPGWLKSASKYLDNQEIVCFGAAPLIPTDSTWVQEIWFKARSRGSVIKETHWLESTNMFIRNHVFKKIQGFDETLITCEDVDISYRLSEQGKIISDPDIKIIHHREPSTITEFFKKERWRGKSNYSGLLKHGVRLSEVPSLLIPVYYGFFVSLFIIFSVFGKPGLGFLCLIFSQAPILLISGIKLKGKSDGVFQFTQLHILYNVYFAARFVSIFG